MTEASRRVRIDLAYDGTDYSGWQFQPAARTVQGTLEGALSRIEGGALTRVRGAGRTDAGVHARGQVADAVVRTGLSDAKLLHALGRLLPADVRPLKLSTVPQAFDPRRDAERKTYRYRLDLTRAGDPFVARFAAHVRDAIDLAAIGEAAGRLVGRRDWSAMAGAACEVDNRVRHLFEARLDVVGPGEAWFTFSADGFLNHMVRILVGTLLEVGRGRYGADRVEEILTSLDRTQAGPTAPAHGLVLWRVEYPARDSTV